DLQEISCGIPRLPQSQLTLDLPADAQAARAVTAVGRQQAAPHAGALRLEADLGPTESGPPAEGLLWVRWYRPADPKTKADVEVSEYHLADLSPDKDSLDCVLKYTVKQGSVSRFQLLLPDHLYPRGVEVRLPDEKGAPPGPGLLKGWKLDKHPGKR